MPVRARLPDAAVNIFSSQPTQIVPGLRDLSVDGRIVELLARAHPNVTAPLLADDHEMMAGRPRSRDDLAPLLEVD